MSYKLVIVESPNKVSTIQKYLGNDYLVMSSIGHITRLSTKGTMGLGINLENWEPDFEIDPDKKAVVKDLKAAVKKASFVYIATDPDREGEAIGDHLVKFLKCKENQYARVKYNEITKDAILKAFDKPGKLDNHLIDAQKARRMLDRIIGFRLSQLMKKKLSNSPSNPSAGRVQSIALKLVIDREKEIEKFIPRGYHTLVAKLNDNYQAILYMNDHEADEKNWIYDNEIDEIKLELNNKPTNELLVNSVKYSQRHLSTIIPLKQAVLYKKSPFSSNITQITAQKLYEGFGDGGLISYPRTDSTRMSETFINNAKKYVSERFGADYVLDEIKGFSGDQDAHEAIRPTDISLTPENAKEKYKLNNYEFQIYKLIYEHTLMCLIKPPLRANKTYTFLKNSLVFKLNISWVIFDGYYIIKGEKEENIDPDFKKGQVINVNEYVFQDHETKPPARYSEGALIEKLDEIKVGRPSTFATTVKIILNREYVKNDSGALHPTNFGKIVMEKLTAGFPDIINEGYTADVEESLDLISQNKISIEPVMHDFYDKFNQNYDYAAETLEHTQMNLEIVDEKCQEDNANLIVRKNGKGEKFLGCENFPKCRFTKSLGTTTRKFFKWKYIKNEKATK
ncbi:type I DNA topoisomerase [Mycoplasma tauri]|uniref:type I DNA topoisomerase n=1 Tax=Mycoplasma tauri TaxID=547987 RepID=UPI0019670E52|nr:type I DNA topoisomerase [Mycoplasma tauri]MBZ4218105.1 type I DNA topoisomerase [Mycoplasma tauri]QSB07806.1 type I DNA topoisomerase [Mycoplasma tauri]